MVILSNKKVKVWGSGSCGKLGLEAIGERTFSQPKDLVALDHERI